MKKIKRENRTFATFFLNGNSRSATKSSYIDINEWSKTKENFILYLLLED